MLKKLIVSNLAVVERVEVEFDSALNVLTGETGAGKSVLMGALDLVLGGRAETSIVRDGAKEAEVEAVFELKEGGKRVQYVIRRTITAEGRSRAWVNDESVTVTELKELGSRLVDVHGPTANQKLVEESFQRETLGKIPASYTAAWREFATVRAELEELKSLAASEDELELLRYQVDELTSAALSEDDDTIAERHAAAAHAGEIVENANCVTEGLGGERGAADTLIALQPKLRAMARHFPSAAEWAERVEGLTVEVEELSRTIADAISRLDSGSENLDELDQRLTLINKLKRKYLKGNDAQGVGALMEVLEKKRARLDRLEHADERRAELEKQLSLVEAEVRREGAALSASRKKVATKLARAITGELKELGFNKANFAIVVEPAPIEAHGMDRVVFMFEPNPGEAARPLAAIASSGEIARVMLALKVVLEGLAETLVFDEIDANIGGEVGRITGEKMRAVAKRHQVIAITHLPQSAVFGERHLVVSKQVSGGRTFTSVRPVAGDERVHEIARMLGGENLTSVVRKHAEELLKISR